MEVLTRNWKYAAPPWRVHEALVREHHGWLDVQPGERTPAVTTAAADRVVLAPWLDADVETVEVLVENDSYGTRLTAVARGRDLSDDRRKAVRHRLGVLFGASLRHWVDGW